MPRTTLLDCTFRDGGYYNAWDFPPEIISDYLNALVTAGVNAVEFGLRSLKNDSYKGPFAYTTDEFLDHVSPPGSLILGVMVNASEIVGESSLTDLLDELFPRRATESHIGLVRIACHLHEFEQALPASQWLADRGYRVGFNLMQIADSDPAELNALISQATQWPIDVLYFADSLGSLDPAGVTDLVSRVRQCWDGEIGFHAHDNMGLGLQNTLRAKAEGVTWLDSTVTGMGRGPGNAKTEQLVLETTDQHGENRSIIPLVRLINRYFKPLQEKYGWGTNLYYFLAGKHKIHPTYIQEMLSDSRYSDEDMMAVIERLKVEGGKRFSMNTLDAARHFYSGEQQGNWRPDEAICGRQVLLLGTGPGVERHRWALENYIRKHKPYVLALNTQAQVDATLIDARVACHPTRLLADYDVHTALPQPLITPISMLPADIRYAFRDKTVFDFGLRVQPGTFDFHEQSCVVPSSLVVAYALAVAASGRASGVLMAGFDGYEGEDPRNLEMNRLLSLYSNHDQSCPLLAVTPTRYDVPTASIYGNLKGTQS